MKILSPLFLIATLLSGTAFAEGRFDLKARGFAHIDEVMPLDVNGRAPRRFNTGFKAYIAGVGRVELRFKRERIFNALRVFVDKDGQEIPAKDNVTLLRGTLKVRNEESSVAGTLLKEGSRFVIKVGFSASNGRGGKVNYYYLTAPVDGSTGHIEKISHFAPALSMHGDTVPVFLKQKSIGFTSPASYRVLKMRVDGDKEWYAKYGSGSISKMESFVNSAEAIYEDQLGITFNVTKFSVAENYTLGTNSSENALIDFREYTLNQGYFGNVEEYQLFSGRTFLENVLGIAYTGPICIDSSYAMSVTTAPKESYGPIIFAHELGHTFGAAHTSTGIMQAIIQASNMPKAFSTESVQQILAHVKNHGDCLGTKPIPSPTPTSSPSHNMDMKLSLTRKGVFTAKFTYTGDVTGCNVKLFAGAQNGNLRVSKIVYNFTPNFEGDTLKARIPLKIVPLPKNRTGFFLGELLCPDESYGETGVKKLNITKVVSKKKLKGKAAWLKKLFKSITRQ